MNRFARSTVPVVLTAAIAAVLLAGCSPEPSTPDPGPGGSDGNGSSTQQPCVVGTWALDVAAYGSASEEFLLGLPAPIEGFDMQGNGTITFTADGLVTTDVDLTSSGTIVAGETRVPFNTPSRYTASGDWSLGGDGSTLDLANWSSDLDHDVLIDPAAPGAPAIDYTGIPSIGMSCSEHELTLAVPGAPLTTTWYR